MTRAKKARRPKRPSGPAGAILRSHGKDGPQLIQTGGHRWAEQAEELYLDALAASNNARCRLNPSPCRGEGQVREANQGEGPSYGEGAVSVPHPPTATLRTPPSPLQGEGFSPFLRLIIAVDPPTGAGTCGIIACARDAGGNAHLLADHSVTAQSPEGWSRTVAEATALWARLHPNAPLLVVAESNQGGLMVQSVLRISDPALRIKLVPAIQGKTDRAAPVAMLFEAGRVAVHGRFPELEAQLCGMIAGGSMRGRGRVRIARMPWCGD